MKYYLLFIFCLTLNTWASRSLKELTLDWQIGDKTGTLKDDDYPYEFSVPVPAGETRFTFTTSGIKADGSTFNTDATSIGVSP